MYAIYIRKSRADLEAEARGEGETLARHRATLTALAAARNLPVGAIYEEVASADTIEARPEMKKLLHDLEQKRWEGVIVMDVDRLGRGDSIDQGRILKTIKYAGAVIVTLYKTFDPSSEMDEEFFEYNQYMSRGEYKRIKRRMWIGRETSAREGRWQSPRPPFGYERIRIEHGKGWTLRPVEPQADAVRLIYSWYLHGDSGQQMGMQRIAARINEMGHRGFTGKPFTASSIVNILKNPTYVGKVRWNYRRQQKTMVDGVEMVKRPRSSECFLADGLHPALIDEKTWQGVQEKLSRNQAPHLRNPDQLSNPFAGIMRCGLCGYTMVRVPEYNRPIEAYYRCPCAGCKTSRIDAAIVEAVFLESLRGWLDLPAVPAEPPEPRTDRPEDIERRQLLRQLETIKTQRDRLHDLLEQGIYTVEVFVERSQALEARRVAAKSALSALDDTPDPASVALDAIRALRPQIEHVLDAWPYATPDEKNRLAKTIVSRIDYHKTHRCTRHETPGNYLSLDLYPAIVPESQV